jgi:hypothetical protein
MTEATDGMFTGLAVFAVVAIVVIILWLKWMFSSQTPKNKDLQNGE